MQRPPFQRTLLAMLPIVGAILSAAAATEGWPMLLSLTAMTMIAASAAAIYWSQPLTAAMAVSDAANGNVAVIPALAAVAAETPLSGAAAPQAANCLASPEPASQGTRADALATGHWRETDLLTGLLNPDVFFTRVAAEIERCRAANQTAILVVCDVDGFSSINENAGLAEANQLLRRVAESFRLKVREGDLLARIGGDEFGLFFPGLPPEIAVTRARDLRAAVRDAGLQILEDGSPQVTACLGIVSYPEDGETVESLLAAANQSLAVDKQERRRKADLPISTVPLLVARS